MWLGFVFLCATLATGYGDYTFNKLDLGGPAADLKTPGFPSPTSGPVDDEFSLRASQPEQRIKIQCSTIDVKGACDANYVEIVDGEQTEKLCGTPGEFNMESNGGRVVVRIRAAAGSRVSCTAAAAPNPLDAFLIFKDEDIDSKEAGIGPASKTTTCPCGSTNPSRIVGGKETKANQYPFIVGIANVDTMFLFCGASIITKRHALTAAHCTYTRTDKRKLAIVAGFHNIVDASVKYGRKGEVIRISEVIEHKGYDPKTMWHDIALLALAEDLQYSTNVQPVCMPTGHVDIVGQFIRVLGWGKIATGKSMSDVLRTVALKVLPIEVCADRFANVPTTNPTQVCTFGHGKDSCQGDSGGPLVWLDPETNRYTLVALVSYGKKECAGENPGLNTEVAAYLKWINDNIKGALTCSKE